MTEEPPDAAARVLAVTSNASVLLQAPAGSGKTTLLAQRYLRLLATVDGPEQILALTFTKRAAEEMRERVHQALGVDAAEGCPADLSLQTFELGVAAQRRMRALGCDLKALPARLRIETMDAFNAWLAAQLPITAGAGGRLNTTDDAEPLYAEAARRTLAHDQPDAFGAAVERVLELDDQRWHGLVELIVELLKTRDRWLPLLAGRLSAAHDLDAEQLKVVRRHLTEDLQVLAQRALQQASAAIGVERLAALSRLMHRAAGRRDRSQDPWTAWYADDSVLTADLADLVRWRAVADLVLLRDKQQFRTRLDASVGFPPKCSDLPDMKDLIAEFARQPGVLEALDALRRLPHPEYDDAQWARVRAVARVLMLAAAHLEQVFREQGRVDFAAVAMAAARALGTAEAPTDLNLRLDYRLRHILVDEFQDTSSAQLALVKLLTAGWQRDDGRTLFCVGDPMQSIYGFRQAEVRAFLELADEGIGDLKFAVERLTSNFRSAPPLVEWINARFAQIFPPRDDRARGAIAFRGSRPARREAITDALVTCRGYASRRDEALAIASLIHAETARHPEWRVGILVRARNQAAPIAAALAARRIACRAVEIDALTDRPVVRDLVSLVRALLHLGDRPAWLALLRCPWVGLTLADLLHVARAAPVIWDGLNTALTSPGLSEDGRRRCARLTRTLDAAFGVRTQTTLPRWIERTWLALGGAACTSSDDLSSVEAVLARLRRLEENGLPDSTALPGSFDDLFAAQAAEASVEIMTIHKAKGLEFDLVVVPALDRRPGGSRHPLLLAHSFARSARDGLLLAARPAVGQEGDPLFDFLMGQWRDAQMLEAQRLLYVACTRARRQLHLTAVIAARTPASGSLLRVLWPMAGREFTGDHALADGLAPAGGPAEAASPPHGGPWLRVPADWSPQVDEVLRDAAVQPRAAATVAVAASLEPMVFDWAGEAARRVGSLVHEELQRFELPTTASIIRAREPLFRRRLALHGLPPELLGEASARVVAALLAVQSDARAAWIFKRGYRDDFREHALTGHHGGALVRVIFDRTFIDDDGVRWVIDYKTSLHGGGRVEEFLDREVVRYGPQLARYAALARRLGPEPVRVGLYFPLMRAWREWVP